MKTERIAKHASKEVGSVRFGIDTREMTKWVRKFWKLVKRGRILVQDVSEKTEVKNEDFVFHTITFTYAKRRWP